MCEHTVSKHPTLPKTAEELLKESVRVQMERAKDPACREQDEIKKKRQCTGTGFQEDHIR
jgi:TolA-binding protein